MKRKQNVNRNESPNEKGENSRVGWGWCVGSFMITTLVVMTGHIYRLWGGHEATQSFEFSTIMKLYGKGLGYATATAIPLCLVGALLWILADRIYARRNEARGLPPGKGTIIGHSIACLCASLVVMTPAVLVWQIHHGSGIHTFRDVLSLFSAGLAVGILSALLTLMFEYSETMQLRETQTTPRADLSAKNPEEFDETKDPQ